MKYYLNNLKIGGKLVLLCSIFSQYHIFTNATAFDPAIFTDDDLIIKDFWGEPVPHADHIKREDIRYYDIVNSNEYTLSDFLDHWLVKKTPAAQIILRGLKLQGVDSDDPINPVQALHFCATNIGPKKAKKLFEQKEELEDAKHKATVKRISFDIDEQKKDKQSIRNIEEIKAKYKAILQEFFIQKYFIAFSLGGLICSFFIFKYAFPYIMARIFEKKPRIINETNIGRNTTRLPKKIPPFFYNDSLQNFLNNYIERENKKIYINRSADKSIHSFNFLLLYGPPGSGKTLFARNLLKQTDALYITIAGNTFEQLSPSQKLQTWLELIAWCSKIAKKKKKEVYIFIDEIEYLLRSRSKDNQEPPLILTSFLSLFADGSHPKIKIIGCTNLPNLIDPAALNRFPDKIKLGFPNENARMNILKSNQLRYGKRYSVDISLINNEKSLKSLAEESNGLSGRDIANIVHKTIANADLEDQESISLNDLLEAIRNEKETIENAQENYLDT